MCGAADLQAADALAIIQDFLDRMIPQDADLAGALLGEQPLLHDFLGAQLVAPVHQRDVLGDVRQVQRLLDRGVAAADHGDPLAAEEEAIAGGAGGHPATAVALLGGQAQVLGRGAGGDDQRIAGVLGRIALEPDRPLVQVRLVDMVIDDFGGKALGMAAHALHQRRTLQALDIPGPVVHLGRGHQLAALFDAGDQQGRAVGPGGVNRGAVAGGAGAENDEAAVPCSRHV